jgi:hypothetical protein
MTVSADMTNNTKPTTTAPIARDESSRPIQLQPAAIQKWLKEKPHDEPWTPSTRAVEKHPASDAQALLKALEQDMAKDMVR